MKEAARSILGVAMRNGVKQQRPLFQELKATDIYWQAQIPRHLAFAADAVNIIILSKLHRHCRTCWALPWSQHRVYRRWRYLDRLAFNGSTNQWPDQSLTEPNKEVERFEKCLSLLCKDLENLVCAAAWKVTKFIRSLKQIQKTALKAFSKALQKAYEMDPEDLLGGS